MIDREEILRIAHFLAEQELVKDVTVGEQTFKAGEKIPEETIKGINRFALRGVVQSYSDEAQNEYEALKNYFLKQKKILKAEQRWKGAQGRGDQRRGCTGSNRHLLLQGPLADLHRQGPCLRFESMGNSPGEQVWERHPHPQSAD
jgi:hypothetical protein